MADVKFSQFVDGDQIQPTDTLVGLRSGVNTKFISPDSPGSGLLRKVNNLSDVGDTQDSIANLGFGNGQILQLQDSDFSGGIYTLTNPCPDFIVLFCNTPDNQLILPSAQGVGSFALSFGPQISSIGTQIVSIHLNSGASFSSVTPNDSNFIKLSNKSTSDGTWLNITTMVSIDSAVSGNVSFLSMDGSVNIVPNALNNTIDFSVSGGSLGSLQSAYDNGNTIAVESSRPLEFSKISLGSITNGVTTPSTGTNNSSNWFVRGFTFVPSSNMYITSLQVEDSTLNTGETRTLGIYEKSSGDQLLSGSVSKTDSLVGVYRTNAVSSPVLLLSGVSYVLASLLPPAQIYRNSTTAVAGADLTITEVASGPSSVTIIPLSFPSSFTATANEVPYGAFQYQTFTTSAIIDFTNDSAAVFMKAISTTQANIPAPVMSDAQFIAIGSPEPGMIAYTNTSNRLSIYDGTAIRQIAYVSDSLSSSYVPSLSNVSGTSALALTKAFYSAVHITATNIVMVSVSFTFTATATTNTVNISIPLGNNFSSNLQASLCGGSIYATSPNIGDGVVLDVASVSSSNNIQLNMLTAVGSGTKSVAMSFMYQLQ